MDNFFCIILLGFLTVWMSHTKHFFYLQTIKAAKFTKKKDWFHPFFIVVALYFNVI